MLTVVCVFFCAVVGLCLCVAERGGIRDAVAYFASLISLAVDSRY